MQKQVFSFLSVPYHEKLIKREIPSKVVQVENAGSKWLKCMVYGNVHEVCSIEEGEVRCPTWCRCTTTLARVRNKVYFLAFPMCAISCTSYVHHQSRWVLSVYRVSTKCPSHVERHSMDIQQTLDTLWDWWCATSVPLGHKKRPANLSFAIWHKALFLHDFVQLGTPRYDNHTYERARGCTFNTTTVVINKFSLNITVKSSADPRVTVMNRVFKSFNISKKGWTSIAGVPPKSFKNHKTCN